MSVLQADNPAFDRSRFITAAEKAMNVSIHARKATMSKRIVPVLPGQSRSTACQRSAKCLRLDGHKGSHRQSLTATLSPVKSPVAPKAPRAIAAGGGVEVLSADRYVVAEGADGPKGRWVFVLDEPATVAKVPAKAPAKARKASPRKVRQLREVAPKVRVGISGIVGQHKNARRPKAAPVGRKDVTIAEQVAVGA